MVVGQPPIHPPSGTYGKVRGLYEPAPLYSSPVELGNVESIVGIYKDRNIMVVSADIGLDLHQIGGSVFASFSSSLGGLGSDTGSG